MKTQAHVENLLENFYTSVQKFSIKININCTIFVMEAKQFKIIDLIREKYPHVCSTCYPPNEE